MVFSDSLTDVTIHDMQALESLYNSTQGDKWFWRKYSANITENSTQTVFFGSPWNFTLDSSESYIHNPCLEKWQGVCCSGNLFHQDRNLTQLCSHVLTDSNIENSIGKFAGYETSLKYLDNSIVGVVLTDYGLDGYLPTQFFNLSLAFLSISYNRNLGRTIPATIGQLQQLNYLSLDANMLSGTLPTELGLLTLLSELYFYHNELSGTIPAELGRLTRMSVLGLNSNRLSGTIPTELWALGLLSVLYLSSNELSGSIPTELRSLTLLSVLYLDINNMSGEIPTVLAELTLLSVLSLRSNEFSNTIPSQLGTLLSLIVLDFSNNKLIGSLISNLSNLTKLKVLLVNDNYLTGSPLVALSTAQINLTTVDLSQNSFSGGFPTSLFELASMQSVSLVSNCFTGSISPRLCESSSLTVLALDGLSSGRQCRNALLGSLSSSYVVNRHMQGSVPACLFGMSSLRVLQLSGNGLGGSLPALPKISSNLRNLSMSHNRLSGSIPTAFQQHNFSLLDLSFNKLSGTLDNMQNFFALTQVKKSNSYATVGEFKQLVLQVNRLSGLVPSTFATVENINLLNGNLFTCTRDRPLPVNDPNVQLVQCGSIELTVVLALWISTLGGLLIGSMCLVKHRTTENWYAMSVNIFRSISCRMIVLLTISVLAYWLIFDMAFKFSQPQYVTHAYQYAYTPSLAFMTSDTPAVWTLISAMTWMSLVYVMMTRHEQSQSSTGNERKHVQWQWRVVAALVAVTLVDWQVMVLANFGYIYTVLYFETWTSYLVQISLTIFKLTVNGWILPVVLQRISFGFINQTVLTGLLLCNNLLIPIFTIVCTEPNCFRYLFTSVPPVTSLFVYLQPCYWTSGVTGNCLAPFPVAVQTSYQPPFIYTYQCSSNMLTTYLPVFVMMYTYIGLIQPLIIAGLTVANIRYKARWSMRITRAVGCDIMLPVEEHNDNKLFDGPQLSVMMILHTVTLLTFGTAYPLLSVLICTAVCVEAVQWRVLIAHYMQSCAAVTDESKREVMQRRLQKSSEGLSTVDLMHVCRWMTMTVMAIFFAFFLMDMAGDKAGDDWSKIVWAPVTMLLWPMMMRLIAHMHSLFHILIHYQCDCSRVLSGAVASTDKGSGEGFSEEKGVQLQIVTTSSLHPS